MADILEQPEDNTTPIPRIKPLNAKALQADQVSVAVNRGLMGNPAEAAKRKEYSKELGVEPHEIGDLNEAKAAVIKKRSQMDRLIETNPGLARYLLNNPITPELASEDLPALHKIARAWRRTALDPIVQVFGKGSSMLTQGVVGAADIATRFVPGKTQDLGKTLEDAGFKFKELDQILEGLLSPEQQLANRKLAEQKTFTGALEAMVESPSSATDMVLSSLLPMAGGGVLGGVLKKVAPGASAAVAAALGESIVITGGLQEKIRQESKAGTTTEAQKSIATLAGATAGGVSAVSNVIARKLGLPDIDAYIASGGLKNALTTSGVPPSLAKVILSGTVVEGAEEMSQSALESVAENVALGKQWDDGLGAAVAQGLVAGSLTQLGFSPMMIRDAQNTIEDNISRERHKAASDALKGTLKAMRAEGTRDMLAKVGDAVSESNLRNLSTDAFAEFVDHMTEDSDVDAVYVPVEKLDEVLLQSGMTESEIAEKMPEVADNIRIARATKGDVRIPVKDYLVNFAGTPTEKSLLDHVKIDPEGMTFAESQEFMQSQQAEFAEQAQQIIAADEPVLSAEEYAKQPIEGKPYKQYLQEHPDQNAVIEADSKNVEKVIVGELNKAGRFNREANAVYAVPFREFFKTAAIRETRSTGKLVTPTEIYERYPLKYQMRDETPTATPDTLTQPVTAATPEDFTTENIQDILKNGNWMIVAATNPGGHTPSNISEVNITQQEDGSVVYEVKRLYEAPREEYINTYTIRRREDGAYVLERKEVSPLHPEGVYSYLTNEYKWERGRVSTVLGAGAFSDTREVFTELKYATDFVESHSGIAADREANAKAHEKLLADLDARGLKYEVVYGRYPGDATEMPSVLVYDVDNATAREFANRYDQDSVLVRDGFIYRDGQVKPHLSKVNVYDDTTSALTAGGYTRVPSTGAIFSVAFNWDADDRYQPLEEFYTQPGLGEALPLTIDVDGVERPTTNSEGRAIHTTREGIRNFWRWFGDSKVVDEQGRPLVVYHATDADIESFDKNKLGVNTRRNTDDLAANRLAKAGFWFNEKPLASDMASSVDMPVYLKIEKPFRSKTVFTTLWNKARKTSGIIPQGNDGIITVDDEFGGSKSFVVINPNQIKSAIGNAGAFATDTGNILLQSKPGAMTLVGVHYSHEKRTVLDGTRYGTGMTGKERDRVLYGANTDDNIKTRVDFYTDTGNGVTPESGLGGVKHEVLLTDIYDASINPLNLSYPPTWDGGNTFEQQVIANGFKGYFVNQGKQGRVVLLGEAARAVPVPTPEQLLAEKYKATQQYFQPVVSTRTPKPVAGRADPHLSSGLAVDLDALYASDNMTTKLAGIVNLYDGFIPSTGTDPQEVLESFINQVEQNLDWLYRQVPPEVVARSRQWYDGGRVIVDRLVDRYAGKYTPAQMAAALALLSPQTAWDKNVSLSERTVDIWTNQQDTEWSKDMSKTLKRLIDKIRKEEKPAVAKVKIAKLKAAEGFKLSELATDYARGVWIRVYDETYNPRGYRKLSPEGGFLDFALKSDGITIDPASWLSFTNIGKVVGVLRDASMPNISRKLGGNHKVRNFYNNLIAPSDPLSVTIDTHAVAAGHLLPLGSSSYEVKVALGSTVSSDPQGLSGSYVLYTEAYRRVAAKYGLLPRELQSIAWEALRGLFTPAFKTRYQKDEALQAQFRELTEKLRIGETTHAEVAERIKDIAGGIQNPSWYGSGPRLDEGDPGSSYTGELLGARGSEGAIRSRARSGGPEGVPTLGLFEAVGLAAQQRAAAVNTNRPGGGTAAFFTKMTLGLDGKPGVSYRPVLALGSEHVSFIQEYSKHRGNFDSHIRASIPGFGEVQVYTGQAIVDAYPEGANVLDIGASEGSWAKTITALSGSKIKTDSLEPLEAMAASFQNISTVEGARLLPQAFGDTGWVEEETGFVVEPFAPEGKYDVVHEAMTFQFIDKDRGEQIDRVKRYMSPDGIYLTEEKFANDGSAAYKEREALKDRYKARYFTSEAIADKAKEVLTVGMNDLMVEQQSLEATLKERFKYVVQYWSAANFGGYIASDSAAAVKNFLDKLPSTESEYSNQPPHRVVKGRLKLSEARKVSVTNLDDVLNQSSFYSALEREIGGLNKIANKEGAVKPDQAIKWIEARQKEGKFKKEEVEAVGIIDWLQTRTGDVKVAAIEDFIRQNGVQLEVVSLAEDEVPPGYDEFDARVWYFNFNDISEAYEYVELHNAAKDRIIREIQEDPEHRILDLYRDAFGEEMDVSSDDMARKEFRRLSHFYGGESLLDGDELEAIRGEAEDVLWEEIKGDAIREYYGDAMPIPEYEDYQLDGGDNYREILFRLPHLDLRGGFDSPHFKEELASNLIAHTRVNERFVNTYTPEEQAQLDEFKKQHAEWVAGNSTQEIQDLFAALNKAYEDLRNAANGRIITPELEAEDPVLAEAADRDRRLSAEIKALQETRRAVEPKRPDIKPKTEKVLFVEEVQSDWAQQGRDFGFILKNPPKLTADELEYEAIIARISSPENSELNKIAGLPPTREEQERLEELRAHNVDKSYKKKIKPGINAAPFVTDTQAWVTLVTKRLLRYAAENGFTRISWTTGAQQAERYRAALLAQVDEILYSKNKYGTYSFELYKNGNPSNQRIWEENVSADRIMAVFGKDIGEKIVNGPVTEGDNKNVISADGLTVGGQGMKDFYDKLLPSVVSKVTKSLGGSGKIEIIDFTGKGKVYDDEIGVQQSIAITPAMVEKIMSGLPLFKGERGSFNPNTFITTLTDGSDKSTVIHEGGHFYLEALADMAAQPDAPQQVKDDFRKTLEWFGIKGGEQRPAAAGTTTELEQKAFHGSPHTFAKFSTSAIGSGEGAQAYGYGLYFTDTKNIAEYYRDKLSEDRIIQINNASIYSISEEYVVQGTFEYYDGSTRQTPWLEQPELAELIGADKAKEIFDNAANGVFLEDENLDVVNTSRIYEVELAPADDEYLLWDKPLSEQSDKVKSAISELRATTKDRESSRSLKKILEGDYTGGDLYRALKNEFPDAEDNNKEAAKRLHELGIRGVKYLDGTSRSKGEGSYNYVVFSEDDVEITAFYQGKESKPAPPVVVDEALLAVAEQDTRNLSGAPFIKNDIETDQQGVIPGRLTSINKSLKRGTYSVNDIAKNWEATRKYLREKYGDTVTLYRVNPPESQRIPDTQVVYMGDENLAKNFETATEKAEAITVRIDDIYALNVQPNGYYEFIVKLPKTGELPKLSTPEEIWAAMTLEQKRPFHEQWAQSFERYILEGKAPTVEMQPVFARFRAWMISVYKSIKEFLKQNPLAGKLNDDVRAIFDRLLATEEKITEMERARSMMPLFASADQAGVTQAKFEAYLAEGQAATDEAISQLAARSLRDMKWASGARDKALRQLQREAKAKRKALTEEVAAEVAQEPITQARNFLLRGIITGDDGVKTKASTTFKLDRGAINELYPGIDLTRIEKMVSDAGMTPDAAAQMFGFSSGQELIDALLNEESTTDKIQGLVDQRMLERYGDLVDDRAIEAAADKAIHNRVRAKFLATGLAMLKGQPGTAKDLNKAARLAAEGALSAKKVRDITPGQYAAAERRANVEAIKRAAESPQSAIEAQRAALLNNHMARIARDIREEVEAGLRYVKKFDKKELRKLLGPEYIEQIDDLLSGFDFRKGTSLAQIDKLQSLRDWIEDQEAEGLDPAINLDLVEALKTKSYKEMTIEEFRSLIDAVKQIEHLGRLKNKLLTAKDQKEFRATVDEAEQSIRDNANRTVAERETPSDVFGKVGKWVRQMFASHRKFNSVIREMDGFENAGVMWRILARPMNEAGDREVEMRQQAAEQIAKLFGMLEKKDTVPGNLYSKKRLVPGTNISMTQEQRIMFGMNWGNEGNRQRLMDGGLTGRKALSAQEAQAILDTITKEEWDFIQGVLDYIGSYKDQIAALEKQLTGIEPKWIEASPIVTKFGTYRGGYFPAKYDADLSTRSEVLEAVNDLRMGMKGAFGSAATKNGYTKERSKQVIGRPILLSFNVISQHVSEVTHRLAWQPWLIDANRLLRALDEPIREHYGTEILRELRNTVLDIATGDVGAKNAMEAAINHLRTGSTIVGMGWRVTTALLQPSGLAQSWTRLGSRWATAGVARYLKNPLEAGRFVDEKSSLMRNRGITMQREINEVLNTLRSGDKVSAVTGSYFTMIGKMQRTVDIPTWIGAYEKHLYERGYEAAEGEEERNRMENEAIAIADQTVIDTQSGGQIKDLASIQRGSPVQKLFTNFYSYFSATYNLNVETVRRTDFRDPASVGLMAVDLLLLNAAPVLFAVALKNMMKGGCDWGDTECLVEKVAQEQVSFLMGQMVVLREVAVAGQAVIGGDAYGYQGPAGLRFFSDLYKLGTQVEQGDADFAAFKAANSVAGALFHYPAGQINSTLDGILAIEDGRVEGVSILPALIAGAPKE